MKNICVDCGNSKAEPGDELCRECIEKTSVSAVASNDGLSLLPLDEEKLKSVIQGIIKEEQWEGGTLIEYEAMSTGIRKFHKWLCEQKEAKR